MKPRDLYFILVAVCLQNASRAEYRDPRVDAVKSYYAQQMRNSARDQLYRYAPDEYKKLAAEERRKADDLKRELDVLESQMRAEENQRAAREQLRNWPRCLAYTAWNSKCGRYCTSRDSIFCHSHQNYIPLGEAITGDKKYDEPLIAAIVRKTEKIFDKETDDAQKVKALQRITSALENCHAAAITGDSSQVESARKDLWDIWHGEVHAIDTRIAERQAQWEREHPEEVAAARNAEMERRKAELSARKAKEEALTNERIGIIETLIGDYVATYDQDRPPSTLHDLATLRVGYNKKDAWGREFLYETDGMSYAICSLGPDGKQGTKDDILVIRKIAAKPQNIEIHVNQGDE